MKTILEKYLLCSIVREGEDAGGGGAGGAGAGAAAAGAGDGSAAGGGNAAAGAAAAGGADGSGDAAAVAAAAAAAAAAAGPYRPEGLADTMFGKDDQETIDKLHNAVRGYRERDSAKGVPDAPEAYRAFDMAATPEAIRPHLEQLAKDPLFDAVAKVAHEEKIPVATMQKLTTALYAQAQEAGILDDVVDDAAERAALLPEAAKDRPKAEQDAAIDARLQANEDFVKLMTSQGLDAKVAEHGLLMLMDTAQGNQFVEFFRGKLTGMDRANPLGPGGGGGGAGSGEGKREQLRAQMQAPEMDPQHPKFDRAKYDALDAEYKKLFPG